LLPCSHVHPAHMRGKRFKQRLVGGGERIVLTEEVFPGGINILQKMLCTESGLIAVLYNVTGCGAGIELLLFQQVFLNCHGSFLQRGEVPSC